MLHPPRRFAKLKGERGWWRLARDVGLGVELYRVVRREAIDVIHAHNYEAPVCAYVVRWLTRVPVFCHRHNALADELPTYFRSRLARALARRFGRALDGQVVRRADFVIALTPELGSFLESWGVKAERMALVPPGLGVEELRAVEIVGARESGEFIVGYAGNLDA